MLKSSTGIDERQVDMWQPCVCSSSYPKKKPALALSLEKSYLEKNRRKTTWKIKVELGVLNTSLNSGDGEKSYMDKINAK